MLDQTTAALPEGAVALFSFGARLYIIGGRSFNNPALAISVRWGDETVYLAYADGIDTRGGDVKLDLLPGIYDLVKVDPFGGVVQTNVIVKEGTQLIPRSGQPFVQIVYAFPAGLLTTEELEGYIVPLNVQADWSVVDPLSAAYVQNKPNFITIDDFNLILSNTIADQIETEVTTQLTPVIGTYLRKTSSGDISTADSVDVNHTGDVSKSSANTAILNQMLADVNAAGGGVLRLSRGTIATQGFATYSNAHISVEGLGERISNLIMTGNTGNLFTVSQNSQGFRTHFSGFSGLKHSDGSTGGAVIRAEYPSVSSSLNNTLKVKNVEGRGYGTTFGAVVVPVNCWNMIIEDIEGEGISSTPATMVGAVACFGKCTVAHLNRIKGMWMQSVISYEAGHFSEGARISGLHGVAVNSLVNMAGGNDAPGVYISQSHGETFDYGIYILNHSQVQLDNVHLYKRVTSTSNWYGVWMEANGAYAGNSLTANGLMISGFKGSTAGGTAQGIFCDDVNGIAGAGNLIENCDTGFGGNDTCTGQLAFTYRNVTAPTNGITGVTVIDTAAT